MGPNRYSMLVAEEPKLSFRVLFDCDEIPDAGNCFPELLYRERREDYRLDYPEPVSLCNLSADRQGRTPTEKGSPGPSRPMGIHALE